MTRLEEVSAKEDRIRGFLSQRGFKGLLISRQNNFSWATAGGENRVASATEYGASSLLYTIGGRYLVANNIEASRVADEEIGGLGYEVKEYPWYDGDAMAGIIRRLAGDNHVASDDGWGGTLNVGSELSELRAPLMETEVERYRELGRAASLKIAETCRGARKGMSEHDLEADLAFRIRGEGITPLLILIAVDERIERYRHPLPTHKKLERYGMVVLGARKWGLIVSITRLVHFGPLPGRLRRKHDAVCQVDATFISHSRKGAIVGEIFQKAQEAYARAGYGEEWRLHHQGGPTGYIPREYRALPGMKKVLSAPQALAWNPSIAGTKSEDTIIAHDGDAEIITEAVGWPMVKCEVGGKVIERPDILVL
jgi:Xaa-Pro aminopeptidase